MKVQYLFKEKMQKIYIYEKKWAIKQQKDMEEP